MVTEIYTAMVQGIEGKIIKVETDISPGLPCVDIIGAVGNEVKEAKERVRVALKNAGISLPPSRVTINLSPGDIRKDGTGFDLAIAVGVLMGLGEISISHKEKSLFVGEIGLNGDVKSTRGVLPITLKAKDDGFRYIYVSRSNVAEASAVEGIDVIGVDTIYQLIKEQSIGATIKVNDSCSEYANIISRYNEEKSDFDIDYADVSGQENAKRVLEIAAAGFHNFLLLGPPGTGKTMLAKRLPTIMPPLEFDECIEVSKIYSVSGLLNDKQNLIYKRPFISPHHSTTVSAMAGGGKIPIPGLISKAHKGILFLDEAVHFSSQTLEVLRQPLEDKQINIARSGGNYTFPAEFILSLSANNCPCGFFPDMNKCTCSQEQIRRYIGKISGPIMDRIDLCTEVNRLQYEDLNILDNQNHKNRSSAEMKQLVLKARKMQEERYKGTNIHFNSQLSANDISRYIDCSNINDSFLKNVYDRYEMSARSYHRLLKVSRTIADLEGAEQINKSHILEALSYRNVENKYLNGGVMNGL